VNSDVKTKLKSKAQQLNHSESFIAAMVIKKYLAVCEQKFKMIDAALKQANHGAFIKSEGMGMGAWINSRSRGGHNLEVVP
jgi:predicted transcriptional regulator